MFPGRTVIYVRTYPGEHEAVTCSPGLPAGHSVKRIRMRFQNTNDVIPFGNYDLRDLEKFRIRDVFQVTYFHLLTL